ncbi:MAG: nicotinate-nucleotide--dimethylbenzimidazole phosphoribosyltransferase [Deltaproteobacteria bacterium]|nr:nicotinate-nucleotide--dimethylbenzimidazole phosphoribosyltransferase [Deltaproteobacteria bacterium]MBW2571987.1 nicotinate-nucleotide--dimethylbenzimidazole phosphoribosyltransferase [Deltaproteobacteria bacterium]MBW2668731.1 nicotinate-nucleotide--dimethylbenzimidazole phosphoribosyltransferase [Deltaproteobacteria bacterium]
MKLEEILKGIKQLDNTWIQKARERTSQLVMPTRALGRLHEVSERLCAIQKTLEPSVKRKAVLVMAGDHGVASEGVSAYPQEVTGAMVQTFLKGGAGINAISRHVGADVWVVDMGIIPQLDPASLDGGDRLFVRKIARGTSSFVQGPAMSRDDAEKSILTGFRLAADLFHKGFEVLGTGDMGIANTTPSAAIGCVVTGIPPEEMVGRGTGVNDEGLRIKQAAVVKGIQVNRPDPDDGLDVLAKVGGFEIGGIAGCILAGAFYGRPVVIDGFISTASALIAHALCPMVIDYIFAGHRSEETGHGVMLKYLGIEPILDLGMRLGEGTGGTLAMSIMEGAVCVFNEVLTFEEAGVSDKS